MALAYASGYYGGRFVHLAHFSISATLAYASRYYGGRGNANPAPEVPRLFKLLMREHLGRVGSSRARAAGGKTDWQSVLRQTQQPRTRGRK